MATPGWRSGHPLNEQLRTQHAGFDYYQLVSLLLRESARSGERNTKPRPVRFRADLSAAFPGHEVSRVEEGRDGSITVSSANFSVASPLGPLPDPYTEWARERAMCGDRAMADFLDLFNNRLHALRFQIKARSRPNLGSESPQTSTLGNYLGAFLGLSDEELAAQLPLPRRVLLALAGLLSDRRRSAVTLSSVLSVFLDAPVVIDQMRGAWQTIPDELHTRLGRSNTTLGENTVLGTRAWDQQARIGLTIGPLPFTRFCQLLPGGELHGDFAALVNFLTDRCVDCEITLRTDPQPLALGQAKSRLGYTTWAGERAHRVGEASFVVYAFNNEEAA